MFDNIFDDDMFLYYCENCEAEFELTTYRAEAITCPECRQPNAYCIDEDWNEEDEYEINHFLPYGEELSDR
jgi:Zn finger protein HypA/HybF involved in hydrogenase expression